MKALLLVLVLLVMLLVSGLGLSYSKHQARRSYSEIAVLQDQRLDLEQRWKQLQLQQSKLSALPLINDQAIQRLGMAAPDPGTVVYIER